MWSSKWKKKQQKRKKKKCEGHTLQTLNPQLKYIFKLVFCINCHFWRCMQKHTRRQVKVNFKEDAFISDVCHRCLCVISDQIHTSLRIIFNSLRDATKMPLFLWWNPPPWRYVQTIYYVIKGLSACVFVVAVVVAFLTWLTDSYDFDFVIMMAPIKLHWDWREKETGVKDYNMENFDISLPFLVFCLSYRAQA